MSKKNAPIKNVSGRPFGFETKVAAYFLAHLLTGAAPWGGRLGSLQEIKFYQRSFGWGDFDDLVLIFNDRGETVRCGLSLKTDKQFGVKGANSTLVQGSWELFSSVKGQCFNSSSDYLGVITQHQPHDVSNALREVLRLAAGQLPHDLAQHLHAAESKLKQKIHDSFACPLELRAATQLQPGTILAKFIFEEFDFTEKYSHGETAAQKLCENALEIQALTEAKSLWNELVRLSTERREEGGSFDLPRLIATLRGSFNLKTHPQFTPQWHKIGAKTAQNLAHTVDHISGIKIPRVKVHDALTKSLSLSSLVLVRGHSGNGKSALLVQHASVRHEQERIVFLRGSELEGFSALCEPHSIASLWATVNVPKALMIIDAIENCRSEEAIRNLVELVHCCRSPESGAPWRLVISCRESELDRLLGELSKRAPQALRGLKDVSVSSLESSEVAEVLTSIPGMSGLTKNKRVIEILRNAKILDVVATRLTQLSVANAQHWAGEADVIEWWWRDIVKQRQHVSERPIALLHLARLQADENISEISASRFDVTGEVLSGLVSERILDENEGRLRFVHDLYADWSRQRQLLAEQGSLGRFLSGRIENPSWHSAVRLLGIHLLDNGDGGQSWRKAFSDFSADEASTLLARDLLIEAAAFCSEPSARLEMLWPELTENKGTLLRRFLVRFLHSCTIPDPSIEAQVQATNPELLIVARANFRVPYFPYWPPVLSILYQHLNELGELDPVSSAKIAKLWLSICSILKHPSEPAGAIALAVAKRIAVTEIDSKAHVKEQTSQIVFEALLAGASERADEVADLLLKLAGRRRWEPSEIPKEPYPDFLGLWPQSRRTLLSFEDQIDLPPQSWPNGPSARSVRVLQKIMLQPNAATALIRERPEVVSECLLAVLLEWPKRRIPARYSGMATDHYGFQYVHDFPPRWWKTPFLAFFRVDSQQALSCLLKLVNHATARASEIFFSEDDRIGPEVVIRLAGEDVTWIGDRRVLNWHRSSLITIDTITSALMAFEKWLYEEIDAGKNLEWIFERIWQETRSLAFIGVLLAIGKKYPITFIDPLKPLLFSRSLHHLDMIAARDRFSNGAMLDEPQAQRKLIEEWESMPHREIQLTNLCYEKLVKDEQWQPILGDVSRSWLDHARDLPTDSEEVLNWKRWAARFDRANWKETRDDKGRSGWSCTLPEDLQDRALEEENNNRLLLLTTPYRCREFLNKRQIFSEQQLEELWIFLEKLAEMSAPQPEDDGVNGLEESICGCIAVLIVLHLEWLKKFPARLAWCETRLNEILSNPPHRVIFSEADVGDTRYDDFAAEAIPVLWAEVPDSEGLRSAIARLALSYRHVTAALLNASAARLRNQLGKKWSDLQSLFIYWASARLQIDQAPHDAEEGFNTAAWEKKWVWAFVKRKIKAPPSRWEKIGIPDSFPQRVRQEYDQDVEPRWFDIDVRFLLAIYKWVPSLDKASSKKEREAWIEIAENFFQSVLRRLPTDVKQGEHISGVPGQVEHAAFNFSNRVLLQLQRSERPERFWKPVLEVGPKGRHWTDAFLTSFLCEGLGPDDPNPSFLVLWIEMIQFAFGDNEWMKSGHHHRHDAWEHLFGWDNVVHHHWIENRSSIVNRLSEFYWRWIDEVVTGPGDLISFLYFLQRPPAQNIVVEACVQIGPVLTSADEYFWAQEHQRKAVLSFVEFLWKNYREKLKGSSASLAAFRTLVAQLAAQLEPLAIEISVLLGKPG